MSLMTMISCLLVQHLTFSYLLSNQLHFFVALESDRTQMVTGNLEVHYIPEKAKSEIQPQRTFEVSQIVWLVDSINYTSVCI